MVKVLIVDDAPLVRERLRKWLTAIEGVDVVGEADSVPRAIQEFRRLLPDIVILDLQMPGGSGIDVLVHVKRERPATLVVMLTNYPLPLLRRKCRQAGAEYFFDKCREFEQVPSILREMISNQQEK